MSEPLNVEDPFCLCAHRHGGTDRCPNAACGCTILRPENHLEVAQDLAWDRTSDAADRGEDQ